jgi:1,4-dihydroxy-2-naphthoyl-CoA hydrolase
MRLGTARFDPVVEPIWHGGAPLDLTALTASGHATMPGLLDIELTDHGPNWLRARMPVTAKVHQPFGRLHGGASVVLAETLGSMGAAMTVDPLVNAVVGMEINANHIRPVRDGYVHATATCETKGRTTQIWTIRIVDDADKLVCLSRLTIAVIPLDRG